MPNKQVRVQIVTLQDNGISYGKMIKIKQHHIKIKYEKNKYQEKVKLKVAYQ